MEFLMVRKIKIFILYLTCLTILIGDNKKLPNDVRWVTESNEYIQLCNQVYAHATYICKVKAQFYNSSTNFKTPAVVLDLDETILDNSQYQVELFYKNESFNMESWSDWVLREEAELVPGSKNFIEFIRSLNIQIIFISNRMDERVDATKSNMKKLGIYNKDDIFLLRLSKEDTKEIRRQEILNGTGRMEAYGKYDVMAYIGDAAGDFPDNTSTNFFILPNPMYGKW